MWLIDAVTLRLEGFERFGGRNLKAPKYAILSHRWGDEEVTFQDISNGRPEGKKGYQKIQGAAKQAIRDSLDYVWVDTCCIDKTSSSELSEAINSMFAWYRDASVCYAYLDDVPSETSGLDGIQNHQNFTDEELKELLRSPFASSKWFTRGWTLQEFIAPRVLRFYNCQWEGIGTKKDLAAMLTYITGIDKDIILHRRALRDVCVARKMSWAARRTTTRIEDTAYCLLGLFGIHLPLLYGEGANAFIRLQQEIIRVSDDQSLFAWEPLDPSDQGLFAPRPLCFFDGGRITLWNARRGNEPWALTNYGLRMQLPLVRKSSGKTAVAVLACRYEDDFTGPLGLVLSTTDSPTVFEASLSPRLIVLGSRMANTAEMSTLYILTDKGPTSWTSAVGHEPENMKCLVRITLSPAALSWTSSWPDFKIQAAFPSRCWNTTTKTMWPRHGDEIKGALHLKNSDGKEFVVALGYPGTQAEADPSSRFPAWVELIHYNPEKSLEQLCDIARRGYYGMDSLDRSTSEYLAPGGWWEATAHIKAEVIMDEKVFVAEVKIQKVY